MKPSTNGPAPVTVIFKNSPACPPGGGSCLGCPNQGPCSGNGND